MDADRWQRLAPWLDRLSLFDVYSAPWFAAIYILLLVSMLPTSEYRAGTSPFVTVFERLGENDASRPAQHWARPGLPAGVAGLKPGQRVEFGIAEGRRGLQALQVRLVEG